MADERLPAWFSLRSQLWFLWTGKYSVTATSHMQTVPASKMRILITFIILLVLASCQSYDREGNQDCSDLKYSLELSSPISDFRIVEKELNSIEVHSQTTNQFGYRERPLVQNERNQPKFFIQELDSHIVETTYYYDLPDSNVYAIIYEWENIHGSMGGTYPSEVYQIDKMPSEEYLKCEFDKLSGSLTKSVGDFVEYENFGTIREWKLSDKTVHLNLTLGSKTNRRLRLVIYKK